MTHAEIAVMDTAKGFGYSLEGTTLVMPWVECIQCTERTIEEKIWRVVTHEDMVLKTPERWWASTLEGLEKLKAKNIDVLMYRGEVSGALATFNGELWFP